MTTPGPHRGRICLLITTAALATCLAAAAPKKAAAKPAAQKADSPSYSVGVSMGEQLRASGVTAEMLDTATLASGVHDAVSGKASLTDKDRDNIRTLVNSVGENNPHAAAKFLADNGKKPDIVTTASGLQYKILTPGSGASPKSGDEVTVNYRG